MPEYNLSKEPIRIDLLIINEENGKKKIENEIGHIMRKYNVIEFKSPEDNLTIDDFYKTVGYACLLKGYGRYVDQIPVEELTVSLFREYCPRKLFLTLERLGHRIEEKYAGIYYVYGLSFPVQVVVTKQLSRTEHRSLRILSANAEREDVKTILVGKVLEHWYSVTNECISRGNTAYFTNKNRNGKEKRITWHSFFLI